MHIEAALKYFSPRGQVITDSPGATAVDHLNVSDMIAAFGLCQARTRFGVSAWLGKAGISQQDRDYVIRQLTLYAAKTAPACLTRAAGEKVAQCMLLLATFAWNDYARSAADSKTCAVCRGLGVTPGQESTIAATGDATSDGGARRPRKYQPARENCCVACRGKGVVTARCRCNGSGRVRDSAASKRLGVTVEKVCERCAGRGFRRSPSTLAFAAVGRLVPALSESSWRRNWKPFYEGLIAKCEREEQRAECEFQKITCG